MMTPQLFVKLAQQIARQMPEAEALDAQALALQPGIDAAQAWVDSCQATVDSEQAALTEAQAVEWSDTTAQQDALNAANAMLSTAKDDLAKAKAPQDEATAHAKQILAQIAVCQVQLDASGMTMTQAEIDAVLNAPVVPEELSRRQAKTLMELTPNATHGNMWLAALAAAEAIADPVQRVVTRNYIADSQVYQRPRVHAMCGLLGLTPAQADQMILAASKL